MLEKTENKCNDPCRDPNCRDAGDHGIGLHCHHDHRDPETKRVHDEFEERERHRDEAIYWLGDNLDKIQNVVNTKETPILNRNNPMNTRERIERIERLLTLVGKVDKTILDESVPVDTTARITISLLMLCLSQELETIREELTC